MKASDPAAALAHQQPSSSFSQVHLGIVSPCASCLNRRSTAADDGRPACPRRAAQAQKQELDANGFDSSYLDLLVLTGVQPGEQDDGTRPLTNPVYDNTSNTVLVWSAALRDNGATLGPTGRLLSPDILDPSFSSDWLRCKPHPFAPRDSEAQYFQQGCLMGGDQVELTTAPRQQVSSQADGVPQALAMAGTVRKVNVHGQFPRQPVAKDLVSSGC